MFIKNATDVKSVIDISLQDSDPSIVLHTFRNTNFTNIYLFRAETLELDTPNTDGLI